jgi:hypothetical protein
MQTREKILVGAMVLALMYGAVALILPQFASGRGSGQAADTYVNDVRATLSSPRLNEQEQQVLDAAVKPKPRNPFRAPATLRQATGNSPVRYTGFIRLGGQILAVLNGREYRQSETIRGTEWVVQSIDTERVELSAKDGGHTLWVMLETVEQKGE